jgi:hypothetical protein
MCISRKPQQLKRRTTVVVQVDMKIAARASSVEEIYNRPFDPVFNGFCVTVR